MPDPEDEARKAAPMVQTPSGTDRALAACEWFGVPPRPARDTGGRPEPARTVAEQPPPRDRRRPGKVVVMVMVIDITAAPDVDAMVADHPMPTVAASRLLGASVITIGLSPGSPQTLVTLGWICELDPQRR